MLVATLLCFALLSFGQDPQGRRQQQAPAQQPTPTPQTTTAPGGPGQQRPPQERPTPAAEEIPVVTKHEITVGGKTLHYTATVGMMPLKNREGETEARIFFMAYALDEGGDRGRRPLTFSFNGGPGSASVWLHLGAIGPKRVPMNPDGTMPQPPYQLVDNEYTWLTQTDLVFIDPVGTGYSRAVRPDLAAKFIVLISTIMNFETADFAPGNDLPYVMYLPSYAATAWYHKKLASDLQSKSVQQLVSEVEQWAANDYTLALAKGDRLTGQDRQDAIAKLARYTGLSTQFVDNANLRVSLSLFRKELLRSERRSIGRLDARFKGFDASYATDSPDFDASEAAIRPPYTSTFNNYVRSELGYKTDLEYYILGGGITSPWNWNTNNGYVDTSVALRTALAKNPYL